VSTPLGGAPAGNKNAAKAKLWEQAIKRAIARKANGDISHGLDSLADKLIAAADAGDQWALKEIGDRLDGKPAQAITGEGGGPIEFVHVDVSNLNDEQLRALASIAIPTG
jgi:hypothetical protein